MTDIEGPVATAEPDEDFERRLRAALTAVVEDVHLPPAAGAKIAAGRRWWAMAGIAAAAVVALVATGVGVVVARGSQTVVPAGGHGSPRATVYGVSIGWLPDGMVRANDSFEATSGPDQKISLYDAAAIFSAPGKNPNWLTRLDEADQEDRGVEAYQVDVMRPVDPGGQMPSLDEFRQQIALSAQESGRDGRTRFDAAYKDVVVGGRAGLLLEVRLIPSETKTPLRKIYAVVWVVPVAGGETVMPAVTGVDRDVVLRIARSVTVGDRPTGPPDGASATAEIRTAVQAAFEGATGQGMLSAVAEPERVRPALDAALRGPNPEQLRQVRIAGDKANVVFVSDSEAVITTDISDLSMISVLKPLQEPRDGLRLVRTDTGWKVTRSSWCAVMDVLVPDCPGS